MPRDEPNKVTRKDDSDGDGKIPGSGEGDKISIRMGEMKRMLTAYAQSEKQEVMKKR